MNLLKGQNTYLAGSIDRASDFGMSWRDEITPCLQSYGCVVLNPLNSPIKEHGENDIQAIKDRHKLIAEGRYDEIVRLVKQIRHNDLRLTDKADFCVCYIDTDVFMCGTIEEISWMNRSKKPILLIIKQGKQNCPLWLFGLLAGHDTIFSSFDELFSYLDSVDNGLVTNNRWVFFTKDTFNV